MGRMGSKQNFLLRCAKQSHKGLHCETQSSHHEVGGVGEIQTHHTILFENTFFFHMLICLVNQEKPVVREPIEE